MLDNSKNKMLTRREEFIKEKAGQGLTPAEIMTILPGQGFRKISRPRIYQIIQGKN